ncbi:hypothetical protein BKG75_19370 [Mycobacteroides chelonae]|nr:hypothetical protein DYE20_09945 [[Mycobacterium] chelonae subsp. gwanakae]OHU11768.1 hypothetical protein BKG75_19370 [Mycobacteroides chelonae]
MIAALPLNSRHLLGNEHERSFRSSQSCVSEGGLAHLRHGLLFSVSEQWFLADEWRLWQLLVASKVR